MRVSVLFPKAVDLESLEELVHTAPCCYSSVPSGFLNITLCDRTPPEPEG